MSEDIRKIGNINRLITYFANTLSWQIDEDDFEDIEDISYDFEAEDLGLKEEAFAKIKSLRQLQPLVDGQKWGIFSIEFDSKKFEVTALRKVLSCLIPKKRNSANHAVWDQKDLLFLCFWGEESNRTIGIAHFEDKDKGLPQIKMIYCAPSVEDTIHIRQFETRLRELSWPDDSSKIEDWHDKWSKAFKTGYRETIKDASTLTIQLAIEAQGIRNRILDTLRVETKNGYVHQLYEKFRNTLIYDMKETEFADMYAQTVVYGLFSARCMDETQEDFSAAEAVECIPNTNPFLKSLMRECLGAKSNSKLSFDELEIGNVVDLLLHTKTDEIIQDFNRQTGGGREDPVIHFYEEFLTEYDKAQKVQRGVFYTPQPVVNFIVRAVNEILIEEFSMPDGLASVETKKVKYYRESKKRNINGLKTQIEDFKEVQAVQLLDPATGTGTFIRQVILQIYENFRNNHQSLSEEDLKIRWNEYVPTYLLPRLNAFELMMAPYAVAHMKLAMVLKDTGYSFASDRRLNVYLANSLEKPGNSEAQMSLFEDPLADESIAANGVKKNNAINVVIGNPPYSGESANKGAWIMNLMESYKKEPGGYLKLQERNPKWLNDDYVKFIRFAQEIIEKAGEGVLAYICPHGFIDNPTFRGMRWSLLRTFEKIYVLDLHGNAKKKEVCPDGSKDENVFDIQQGVCIFIAIKKSKKASLGEVWHADLYGLRNYKYDFLNNNNLNKINFCKVNLVEPQYFFVPKDFSLANEYEEYEALDRIFTVKSVGVVSAKDKILVDGNKDVLSSKVEEYYNLSIDKSKIEEFAYRPFDTRYVYYDVNLLERPREEIMSHFRFGRRNYGICLTKVVKSGATYQNCFVCDRMIDSCYVSNRTSEITYVFPLLSYQGLITSCNINPEYLKKLENILGVKVSKSLEGKDGEITVLNIFDYIYARLFSPDYRNKYVEFLKIDFPKIPYPSSLNEFMHFVSMGRKLREVHLMENELDTNSLEISECSDMIVSNIGFKEGKLYINKNLYIKGIDIEDYEFDIGAYKPVQKWLKDRKNQNLTIEDINYLCKIIIAIKKTRILMNEIDCC